MNIKQFIVEAISGFTIWTTMLTPYMIGVINMSIGQYLDWIVMQICLVPFLSIIALRFTEHVKHRLLKEKTT